MTINEKLDNFKERAIKDANMQSQNILRECEQNIKTQLTSYEENAKNNYLNKVQVQSDVIISENNKKLSSSSLKLRQRIEKKRLELIDNLFDDLENKLIEYKKTDGYKDLLLKQIQKIESFADNLDTIIYIDKSDSALLDILKHTVKSRIEISPNKILGGTKGIIKEKNILIDYSFSNKLAEEKTNFSF